MKSGRWQHICEPVFHEFGLSMTICVNLTKKHFFSFVTADFLGYSQILQLTLHTCYFSDSSA